MEYTLTDIKNTTSRLPTVTQSHIILYCHSKHSLFCAIHFTTTFTPSMWKHAKALLCQCSYEASQSTVYNMAAFITKHQNTSMFQKTLCMKSARWSIAVWSVKSGIVSHIPAIHFIKHTQSIQIRPFWFFSFHCNGDWAAQRVSCDFKLAQMIYSWNLLQHRSTAFKCVKTKRRLNYQLVKLQAMPIKHVKPACSILLCCKWVCK